MGISAFNSIEFNIHNVLQIQVSRFHFITNKWIYNRSPPSSVYSNIGRNTNAWQLSDRYSTCTAHSSSISHYSSTNISSIIQSKEELPECDVNKLIIFHRQKRFPTRLINQQRPQFRSWCAATTYMSHHAHNSGYAASQRHSHDWQGNQQMKFLVETINF